MNRPPMRSWIEVDLKRLEDNVRGIKSHFPTGVKYICVVKADAYGHCMPQAVGRFLRGGADIFAVANLHEVSRVREIVSSKPVLVLSPILYAERHLVFDYGATPSISNMEEARHFDSLSAAVGKVLDVHIKVDTGMGRVGVWHEKAVQFIEEAMSFKNIRIAGIFSHFSCADTDKDYTFFQYNLLKNIVSRFDVSNMLIHMHNSAALEYIPLETPFNAVRVGLLQYGINPRGYSANGAMGIRQVLSFKAKVAGVSNTAQGGRIVSISAGYADGVPAGFKGSAYVLIGQERCPVIGHVSLDECFADASAVSDVKVGDEVVFIGEQGSHSIDLCDYSKWTCRIPWETMVAIPKRVERVLIA